MRTFSSDIAGLAGTTQNHLATTPPAGGSSSTCVGPRSCFKASAALARLSRQISERPPKDALGPASTSIAASCGEGVVTIRRNGLCIILSDMKPYANYVRIIIESARSPRTAEVKQVRTFLPGPRPPPLTLERRHLSSLTVAISRDRRGGSFHKEGAVNRRGSNILTCAALHRTDARDPIGARRAIAPGSAKAFKLDFSLENPVDLCKALYIRAAMNAGHTETVGLGTLLRHLIERLDGDVSWAYSIAGLEDYRPRFTPIVRALERTESATIGQVAKAAQISHSAASQTIGEMVKRGLLVRRKGQDGREAHLRMTRKLKSVLPLLHAQWSAVYRAEAALNSALPFSLRSLAEATLVELDRRSFASRIAEAIELGPDRTEKETLHLDRKN